MTLEKARKAAITEKSIAPRGSRLSHPTSPVQVWGPLVDEEREIARSAFDLCRVAR